MTVADPAASPGTLSQLRRIGGLMWAERRPYLTGSVFVAISICTSLAYPYVIRLIIDDAITGGQLQRLNDLSLTMVGILLLEALSICGRDYFFGLGAERVGARIRRLVFRALLAQDLAFFDSRDTGAITTRLAADVPPLESVLGEELSETLRAAVFSVCGAGLLFYTSPLLTLLMLISVPPIAFATFLLGRRVKTLSAGVQASHADAAPRQWRCSPVSAPCAPSRRSRRRVSATTAWLRGRWSSGGARRRRGRCSAARRSSPVSWRRCWRSGSAAG